MERTWLPKYEVELDRDVKELMMHVISRTMMFDGWDTASLLNLLNFVVGCTAGEEFLGDEDVTGKPKDAPALTSMALKYLKKVQDRYGFEKANHELKKLARPATEVLVTDNPTVMQAARPMIIQAAARHESLYQPYLFELVCSLHGYRFPRERNSADSAEFRSVPQNSVPNPDFPTESTALIGKTGADR